MNKQPESFHALIWNLSRKMKWYSFLIAVALSVIFTSILMRQTHEVLCALVESQLEQISGPLARELILGENGIAQEIFQELRDELQALGTQEDLRLSLLNGNYLTSLREKRNCVPKGFHAEVQFPVTLSGMHLGNIQGNVSHFSSIAFFIYISIILSTLALTFRSLIQQILKKLQKEIIQPIYKISNNEEITLNQKTPIEVIQIQQSIEQLKTTLVAKERYELALQVAHDIRSPVAALEMISGTIHSDPEESLNIMRSALNRIKYISNHLLKNNQLHHTLSHQTSTQNYPLHCLVESLVLEARAQFREHHQLRLQFTSGITPDQSFVNLNSAEFKTVLSNLINNAAEALNFKGTIQVNLQLHESLFKIEVKDDGPGIPTEILSILGTRGVSYQKANGNGLGIYHAITQIQSWGGSLEIQSHLGLGSCLRISLPQSSPSSLFPQNLHFSKNTQWICLDDDPSIHEIWKLKAKQLGLTFEPLCFSAVEDLLKNEALFEDEQSFFLLDYHLRGQIYTGLDLVIKLPLAQRALLITQDYDSLELQNQCSKLQVPILPKPLLPFFIPRILNSSTEEP